MDSKDSGDASKSEKIIQHYNRLNHLPTSYSCIGGGGSNRLMSSTGHRNEGIDDIEMRYIKDSL